MISSKGLAVLGLRVLPKDLPALEALIHPDDLDRQRLALEHPRSHPFDLRLRRDDGSWVHMRWTLIRGAEGYRGVFAGIAEAGPDPGRAIARFNYLVRVFQES